MLPTILGTLSLLVAFIAVVASYHTQKELGALQSRRDQDEWFGRFRAIQADFWSGDAAIADARRMIANRPDYDQLRQVLLRRNPSYAKSPSTFRKTVDACPCDLSRNEYHILDSIDRLLAIMVRIRDAELSSTTAKQRTLWHLAHYDYWLRLIQDGERPELTNYCADNWGDLAQPRKALR